MKKQHSPLPWVLDKNGIFDKDGNCIDVSGDNYSFIVQSVNNHDALTKALKTCVVALYAHPELSSRAREAIQEAEAVLGQLEGKE